MACKRKHKGKRVRVPLLLRGFAAEAAFQALPECQKTVAREQGHRRVSFGVREGKKCRSQLGPLTVAHERLKAQYPEWQKIFGAPSQAESARKTIRYWFNQTNYHCLNGPVRELLLDLSRAKRVGRLLQDQHWQVCLRGLTQATWEDKYHNYRRFSSLFYYRDSLPDGSVEACLLDEAKLLSKANTWEALDEAVAQRFGLRRRKEQFKPQRNEAQAQWCAKRWLGQEPMVELHRSRGSGKVSSQKIIRGKTLPTEAERLDGVQPEEYQWFLEPTWTQV